ncbi:FAM8A1 [Cervus elaphus hippelaphus]|uniref:FAM8A1 n=1 Tax=Cervus elaphus hippelaphus TaxID=46360 RepID=A0A212D4S1_CEREH|nr:FAM8A1 [Cervus elaphus hippelaphus]
MAEGPEEARGRPPGQDDGGGNQESVPSLRGLPAAAAPLSQDGPQAEPQAPGRPPASGLAAAAEESEPPRELENRGEAASGSDSGSGAGLQEPASCEASEAAAPPEKPARLSAREYSRQIICIWGAGGATPGKFLLGLRVVTCDTSVLIAPSRVLVIPSSNVSITTSTIRALIKNFSIASFFPAFITLLFFQHNRTAYDIVAGTIVVKRNGVR